MLYLLLPVMVLIGLRESIEYELKQSDRAFFQPDRWTALKNSLGSIITFKAIFSERKERSYLRKIGHVRKSDRIRKRERISEKDRIKKRRIL